MAYITLRSLHSPHSVDVEVHLLDSVSTTLPSFTSPPRTWDHLERLALADADFLVPRHVDVIIGADYYGDIIKPNLVRGPEGTPIAQLSIFGWLVIGPVQGGHSSARVAGTAAVLSDNAALQELLIRFWTQEETPSDKQRQLTSDEKECEEHFQTTHSRDTTGRYVVRIPLRSAARPLGRSWGAAQRCLQQVLRRLNRDATYSELYRRFLEEYEELGHMVKAPPGKLDGDRCFYLPHLGVLRPDRETTKLRVVFNGSATTTSGLSLNDIMHTGAKLQLDIPDVLLWIRLHRFLFATDITKMFRQIRVHSDDWDLQRILWVDKQQKVVPYQLTTVTYGTRAAPFLSVRTLLQLAEDEGQRFPLAVPGLRFGRYVDDIFGGADWLQQLVLVAQDLKDLCDAGGFPLAKWHTAHSEILKRFSPMHSSGHVTLDDCATNILGLRWLLEEDRFVFTSGFQNHAVPLTKRGILSEVAQIFDPLGFITPVTVRSKMLLQELWLQKVGWDEPLPTSLITRWTALREDLQHIADLSLPRWLGTLSNSTVELHGFADASQLAMSAVIYIVVHSPSKPAQAVLVCSKTKVAPIQRLTIPRLELTAALMVAKLARYVRNALRFDIRTTHLWTDSLVTLMWVRSRSSRWKDFVQNRVSQIQELSANDSWRHVPGVANPANCASRGVTTAQLRDHSLWWTGPPWMTQPEDTWPTQPPVSDEFAAQEARPGISLHVAAPRTNYHWDLIDKVSTAYKLFRLTALCSRVTLRMRRKLDSPVALIPSDAMEEARRFWTKATQAAWFAAEMLSLRSGSTLPSAHPFSRLTAFIDAQGVIRVGGRLEHSSLTEGEKHPAILPRHTRLTDLLVDQAHRRTLHGGTQLTLAFLRQSVWIIGGRAAVKSHVLRCVTCVRQRGIRARQLMGQLPLSRATPSRPFSHVGVDYAGPLSLKTWRGRGAKVYKGWLCVFVCFATSAVHLEAVTDYSTSGFIAAYRRFAARRGLAHTLYSDCGTNFVGADATIRRLFTSSTQEHRDIAADLSTDCTQWRFNPPAAPHMGGKWEAVVKLTKHHLRRTVGETVLTYEEFSTLLSQIEATLNSRPLEPLSDDPGDVSALTPGHFLVGGALNALPEPTLPTCGSGQLAHWQLVQQRVQAFWTQWSAHYLKRQLAISKWHHPSNQLRVGSLVLLTDERFPPCKWPLARVTALHPGQDGLTRVVSLRTATTTLTRPIVKLAPLPPLDRQEDVADVVNDGGRNVADSER